MPAQTRSVTENEEAREARLTEFVADLTQLRREAGQPSLRKMSETGHYSHTALSGVLSGQRLPSRELTLAFVRACAGDEDEWRDRWQRENELLYPNAQPPGVRRGRRSWLAVLAVLLPLVAVAVVVVVGWASRERPGGAPQSPVVDGADPQEERCQLDVVNAATVRVEPDFGVLNLRYSPRCRAAWPQFVSTVNVPTGAGVHLDTVRPAVGTVTGYDLPYLVEPRVYSVYGNMLRTTRGCVSVSISLMAPGGQRELARATTPCLTLDRPS